MGGKFSPTTPLQIECKNSMVDIGLKLTQLFWVLRFKLIIFFSEFLGLFKLIQLQFFSLWANLKLTQYHMHLPNVKFRVTVNEDAIKNFAVGALHFTQLFWVQRQSPKRFIEDNLTLPNFNPFQYPKYFLVLFSDYS